ncbi:hypothetical protein D3C77_733280 [compost metagenome]
MVWCWTASVWSRPASASPAALCRSLKVGLQLISAAAMLMVKPRIAVLKTKPTSEWARTMRRICRSATPTSEVCTATLRVKEK